MSRLKISDLSFCETELPSNSQVQGGLSISLGYLLNFDNNQPPTFSVVSPSYRTEYFVDNNSGISKYKMTDKNGNIVGAGATGTFTGANGSKYSMSVSAISTTGNLFL